MMFPKSKPFRSKELLKFAHEEMSPAPCCVCRERQWTQLHHFGDDGGKGLKPSDNEVARTCQRCHQRYDFKRLALIKKGTPEYLNVLESYQNDALKINRAYIEKLEKAKLLSLPASRCSECGQHVEPINGCALEKLNLWLATEGPGLGPDEQRDWLLAWADRRAAEIVEAYLEGVEDEDHLRAKGEGA